MADLVLSLFPGLGLLDMAFEEEGFCIVRGPDLLWGGDVRRFHPPAGKFEGVIGGPPCQLFSGLNNLARSQGTVFVNLIPEFERCIAESQPSWFLMENVRSAPLPNVAGYVTEDYLLNNRWLGEVQQRVRRFTFGRRDIFVCRSPFIMTEFAALEAFEWEPAVTAAHAGERRVHNGNPKIRRFTPDEAARFQGLPDEFLRDAPLTQQGRLKVLAQGVPLPMGRAIAKAVKRALTGAPREAPR